MQEEQEQEDRSRLDNKDAIITIYAASSTAALGAEILL